MSERLNWGLIGGGEGSQIGFAHRIGAELDGKFKFAAGALDVDPQRSREYGKDSDLLKTGPTETGRRCSMQNLPGTTALTW